MSAGEQLRIADVDEQVAPPPADPAPDQGLEPPPATPEQKRAIATRDRDVFLEAGAGTGKTGVLVRRYCDAVTEDGVGIDAILAFTFTEKAAGELRGRIRAELARRAGAAAQHDAERGRELWRLARDTERAWIGTIHGFCRRLLAAHPVAAGLDPRFRVLDEAEAQLVAERAFEAALEELTADGEAEAEAVAAGFSVPRLRRLIISTHEKLRSQGFERPALPEMPEPALTRANGKEAEQAPDELTPAEAAAVREAYRCLRALLDAFCRHFHRLKGERSALDFEDLQLRALRLLRERPAIAAAYGERFEHLMVDEFQDTNRVQLDLIRELRGPGTRVFSVGDEFQSIYGFRHADLEVFRAERGRAEEAPDSELVVLPLLGNFRSHPVVLAAVNALGDALLDGFKPLTGGADDDAAAGEPAAELLLTEADGWDAEDVELEAVPGEQTSPPRVAEARFLATRLRELADAGVPRGEMVVLLRAFTHITAYEEALERAGLAPYVVGGRGYWSDQQVEDLLRLLACIANPLDDESLFGALSSPACGVSPDALWMLRQQARDPEGWPRHVWPVLERHFGRADERGEPEDEPAPERRDGGDPGPGWASRIGPDDAARLRDFHSTLVAVRSEAALLSLEALTDRAARDFGYDLAVLMRDRGPQRLANVRKLMRLARRFEAAEGRDLSGFLRYAEARSARDEREGLAATQAEDHDGVRIMTIHAAKGLEFGTVAVADLGRQMLAGGRPPDLWLGDSTPTPGGSPAQNGGGSPELGLRVARAGEPSITLWEFKRLQDEAAAADAAEGCRLTYVAATRAQHRLLLSGVFTDKDLEDDEIRPTSSAIKRLLPALRFDGTEEPLAVPDGRIDVRINRASPEAARELVRRAAASAAAPAAGSGGPPPLLPPAGDAYAVGHLSYAALADYERCGYRFYAERVLGLRLPDAEDSAATAGERSDEELTEADLGAGSPAPGARELRLGLGNAVHSLLEWSARNRWRVPGRDRRVATLRQEGLAGDEVEVDRAGALVDGWLGSELRASLEGPDSRLRPEAPFVLAVGDSVVRGKMDLLAELRGELVVVDYKTDALGDAEPEEHAARYATQRDLYALAAAAWRSDPEEWRLSGKHSEKGATAPRGRPPPVRTVYCFLERPDRPVEQVFAPGDLDAARERIEGLIAGVAAGRFEVTSEPHRALCLDCPARERLCIHESDRTMAPLGP